MCSYRMTSAYQHCIRMFTTWPTLSTYPSQRLRRKAQLLVSAMKHDKLALEKDIPVDRERQPARRLDAAKALRRRREALRVHGRKVDQAARHDSRVRAN